MKRVGRTEALRRENARLQGQINRLAAYARQLEDALERQGARLEELRRVASGG